MKKECIRCGKRKGINEFYPHPQMADGYLNKCKKCCKLEEKLRRIEHPDKIKKYESKRSKRKKRIVAQNTITKRWRKNNPEKYRAQNKLNNALGDGKITKPERCEICGREVRVIAHHFDYSKPLEVIWSCSKCHNQIHLGSTS